MSNDANLIIKRKKYDPQGQCKKGKKQEAHSKTMFGKCHYRNRVPCENLVSKLQVSSYIDVQTTVLITSCKTLKTDKQLRIKTNKNENQKQTWNTENDKTKNQT